MPQRKKTPPPDLAATAAELPELTGQQQKFVEGILAGKSATDAYRAAYNTADMSQRTIWAEASRLNTHPAIAAWTSAARQAGLGSAVVTFENHMLQLERLREIALSSGNVGAAVQAEQIRGKAAGHHVDQIRDVTERHDPAETIRQIAQHSPELAAALAAANGIDIAEGATKH